MKQIKGILKKNQILKTVIHITGNRGEYPFSEAILKKYGFRRGNIPMPGLVLLKPLFFKSVVPGTVIYQITPLNLFYQLNFSLRFKKRPGALPQGFDCLRFFNEYDPVANPGQEIFGMAADNKTIPGFNHHTAKTTFWTAKQAPGAGGNPEKPQTLVNSKGFHIATQETIGYQMPGIDRGYWPPLLIKAPCAGTFLKYWRRDNDLRHMAAQYFNPALKHIVAGISFYTYRFHRSATNFGGNIADFSISKAESPDYQVPEINKFFWSPQLQWLVAKTPLANILTMNLAQPALNTKVSSNNLLFNNKLFSNQSFNNQLQNNQLFNSQLFYNQSLNRHGIYHYRQHWVLMPEESRAPWVPVKRLSHPELDTPDELANPVTTQPGSAIEPIPVGSETVRVLKENPIDKTGQWMVNRNFRNESRLSVTESIRIAKKKIKESYIKPAAIWMNRLPVGRDLHPRLELGIRDFAMATSRNGHASNNFIGPDNHGISLQTQDRVIQLKLCSVTNGQNRMIKKSDPAYFMRNNFTIRRQFNSFNNSTRFEPDYLNNGPSLIITPEIAGPGPIDRLQLRSLPGGTNIDNVYNKVYNHVYNHDYNHVHNYVHNAGFLMNRILQRSRSTVLMTRIFNTGIITDKGKPLSSDPVRSGSWSAGEALFFPEPHRTGLDKPDVSKQSDGGLRPEKTAGEIIAGLPKNHAYRHDEVRNEETHGNKAARDNEGRHGNKDHHVDNLPEMILRKVTLTQDFNQSRWERPGFIRIPLNGYEGYQHFAEGLLAKYRHTANSDRPDPNLPIPAVTKVHRQNPSQMAGLELLNPIPPFSGDGLGPMMAKLPTNTGIPEGSMAPNSRLVFHKPSMTGDENRSTYEDVSKLPRAEITQAPDRSGVLNKKISDGDINSIADRVYRMIEKRITIEKDRRGLI